MNNAVVYNRGEVILGLESMSGLMECIKEKIKPIPAIQIAGTNGKGSTGAFIKNILESAGLKVGYYQTPAVLDPMEIISINGVNISQAEFDIYMAYIDKRIAECEMQSFITKFERDTAMAFLHFSENDCDMMILETGLGGDTDATNICTSTIMSVITPIGMDHMEYLGNSLENIAEHKAGIIKAGAVAVVSTQREEAMKVIKARAKQQHVKLVCAGTVVAEADGLSYEGINGIEVGLKGDYQKINVATAISAVMELRELNDRLSEPDEAGFCEIIKNGIRNTALFGRYYSLGTEPQVILDGAHNESAAIALKNNLERENTDIIYMTAVFADKEYMKVIKTIADTGAEIYTTTAPGGRAKPGNELAEELKKAGYSCYAKESIQHMVFAACDRALEIFNEKNRWPMVVGFGSLSWLAEAKEAYVNWKNKT